MFSFSNYGSKFGKDYGYPYGRTKNPVNESGSDVAAVGGFFAVDGLLVGGCERDRGNGDLHVVRLVVAKKK